jgi:opacity protein-like surface antigen
VRILPALALAIVLVAASALPARADGFATPFIGFNFGGDSSDCESFRNCEDKRRNYGISLGSMGNVFGFETDFSYANDFFGKVPGTDSSVFSWMNSLLVGVGAGPIQPYGLVGVGLIRVGLKQITDFSKNSFGYDIGAGVNIYFSRSIGVRGDIRHLRTAQDVPILSTLTNQIFEDSQKLDFWRASAGVSFKF